MLLTIDCSSLSASSQHLGTGWTADARGGRSLVSSTPTNSLPPDVFAKATSSLKIFFLEASEMSLPLYQESARFPSR